MTGARPFDLIDAIVKARVARIAYQEPEPARSTLHALGFDDVKFYSDRATGTHALMAANETRAVFAARGTEKDFADILTDLKFRKEDLVSHRVMMGCVHRGFLASWRAIRSEVELDVLRVRRTGRKVDGTGHSLGGAIAILAGADLGFDHVTTYGAPRVGDADFAAYVDRAVPHHRVARRADIVPLLPLITMGYEHGGTLVYIDDLRRIHIDPPWWREVAARARAVATAQWTRTGACMFIPTSMFTDHRVAGYESDLERAV